MRHTDARRSDWPWCPCWRCSADEVGSERVRVWSTRTVRNESARESIETPEYGLLVTASICITLPWWHSIVIDVTWALGTIRALIRRLIANLRPNATTMAIKGQRTWPSLLR